MRDELRPHPRRHVPRQLHHRGRRFRSGQALPRRRRGHRRRRRDRDRLHRHLGPVGRRDQRVVLADDVGCDLRGAVPRRPQHPDERRLLPRGAHGAAAGHAREPVRARGVRWAHHQRHRGHRSDPRGDGAGAPRPRGRGERADPRLLPHGHRRRRQAVGQPLLRLRRRRRAPRCRRSRRDRLLLPGWALGDPAGRAARGAVPVRRAPLTAAPRLRRRRAVARRPRHRAGDRAAGRRRAHGPRRPHRAAAAGRARRRRRRGGRLPRGARRRHRRRAPDQGGRRQAGGRRSLRDAHVRRRRARARRSTAMSTRCSPTCSARASPPTARHATTASSLDAAGTAVDHDATAALRAKLRTERHRERGGAGDERELVRRRRRRRHVHRRRARRHQRRGRRRQAPDHAGGSACRRHRRDPARARDLGRRARRRVARRARHHARDQRDPRAEGRPDRVRRHRRVRRPPAPRARSARRGGPLRPLLHHADAAGRAPPHVRGDASG